jgi:hypothetical protein
MTGNTPDPSPRSYPSSVSFVRRASPIAVSSGSMDSFGEIKTWLLEEASAEREMIDLLVKLIARMKVAGSSIDRLTLHIGTLHPQLVGFAWVWSSDDGFCDEVRVADAAIASDAYKLNPLQLIVETGEPLLLTAAFTGLRASELRGLRWKDVNLKEEKIHVQQRADRLNQIGRPKTAAGDREIPIRPVVIQALREWKLQCPRGDLGLVFPNGDGGIENLSNILQRGFQPAQVAAGVTAPVTDEHGKPTRDEDGDPVIAAKYYGLHSLRHFHASWLINRKADGGLELPPKEVQTRLGHSSITMTMDVYGHLFPRRREDVEITELERSLSLT